MRIDSSKKADISMNTIVMAAIAIMVLLVIILIFTSNIRKPAGEVGKTNDERGSLIDDIVKRDNCEGDGTNPAHGACKLEENCKGENEKITSLYKCISPMICCITN